MRRFLMMILFSMPLLAQMWSVVYVKSGGLNISARELKPIYLKTVLKHSSVVLLPLNLEANHAARKRFMQSVLHVDATVWNSYFDRLHFQGVASPKVVTSTVLMKQYLLRIHGAVGYIPTADVTKPLVEITRFRVKE